MFKQMKRKFLHDFLPDPKGEKADPGFSDPKDSTDSFRSYRFLRILQILSDPVDSHGFSRILMDSRGFFWLLMDSRIYFRIYFTIGDGAFVINDSHFYLVNDL